MSAPADDRIPRRHYAEALALAEAGLTYCEIGARLGITDSAVGRVLRGGPLSRPNVRRRAGDVAQSTRRVARAPGETQRIVVETIQREGPLTITRLALAMATHVSHVGSVVKRLEHHRVCVRDPETLAYALSDRWAEAYEQLVRPARPAPPVPEAVPAKAQGSSDEERRLRTRVLINALEREARAAVEYREALRLSQWGLQQHARADMLAAQAEARTAAGEAARVGVDVEREVAAWRARAPSGEPYAERRAPRLGGHR